jgi:outer membrane lipoprotein LolB
LKVLLAIILCVLLSACTTTQLKPAAPGETQLQGLFGIVTPQTHESGHFVWEQNNQQQFSLELYGPLGLGATSLIEQNGVVILETVQGKKYTATSPELLLQNNLGWSMPIQGMTYWLFGVPVPTIPFVAQYDALNRIVHLLQSGWTIDYTWQQNRVYPARILMQRQGVRLIVAITHS